MSTHGRVPPDEPDDSAAARSARRLGHRERLVCRYEDHAIDQGQPARLVVTGEVDLTTVEEFGTALDLAVALHPQGPGLVVDLRGLNLIGVVGVRALHRRRNVIRTVLVSRSGIVHQVLAMTMLDHDIPIVAEVQATEPPRTAHCRICASSEAAVDDMAD